MTFLGLKLTSFSRVEVGLAGQRLVRPGYREAEPRQDMVRTGIGGWCGSGKEGDKLGVFLWGQELGSGS